MPRSAHENGRYYLYFQPSFGGCSLLPHTGNSIFSQGESDSKLSQSPDGVFDRAAVRTALEEESLLSFGRPAAVRPVRPYDRYIIMTVTAVTIVTLRK